MGLDMYLTASSYVGGWSHSDKEERERFDLMLKAANLTREDVSPLAPAGYVKVTVGYWRKANAIHAWFVKHTQEGRDECQTSDVDRADLRRLRDTCQRVLDDNSLAMELLPPQDGFFFGGTAIDNWYFDDLKSTIEIIDKALDPKFKGFSFEYHASW